MTILVAGATGLAGSAIVRELTRVNKNVIGISSKDVNLLDRAKTLSYIKDLKPTVLIDAAAKVGGVGAIMLIQLSFCLKIYKFNLTLWMQPTRLKWKNLFF